MDTGALIFTALVLALTTGVLLVAWRSVSAMRAFRGGFTWAFLLVLLMPWAGAYSAEAAIVNAAVSGLLAAAVWWLLRSRLHPRDRQSA